MATATGLTGPRGLRQAPRLARRGMALLVGALVLAACAPAMTSPAVSGGASTEGTAPSTSASAPSSPASTTSTTVTSSSAASRTPSRAGSASGAWTSGPGAPTFAFYDPAPIPAGSVHGTLLRYQLVGPVPGAHTGATLWRILYLTRTATGTAALGSGYVAVPGRAAPADGYPVIAWAHGTTGMARACAPSLLATTLPGGLRKLMLAPYLATLVDQGYLVTAADYPGLGTQGTLGYYSGAAEGHAVLDALRAAQRVTTWHASRTAVIFGHSQGGHAALFAGQFAAAYTPEQRIVGVIAASPVAWLTGIASGAAANSGPVNADVLLTAVSWARTYPGLRLDQLLTPSAMGGIGRLTAMCDDAVEAAYRHTSSSAVFRPGAVTNPEFAELGRTNTPGAVPTAAPILIVQGDNDNEVNVSATTSFVRHLCADQPDRVTYTVYPRATHDGVLTAARSPILGWIAARFAGRPVATGCG